MEAASIGSLFLGDSVHGGDFRQAAGAAARKAEGDEPLTRRCNLNLKVRWNVGNWRAPLLRRQRVFVLRFRRLPWTPSFATPRRAWGSYFFGGPARQPSPSMAASAAHGGQLRQAARDAAARGLRLASDQTAGLR